MELEGKVSDEYRKYWEKTVNCVFNQIIGTSNWNFFDRFLSLDFYAESMEVLQLKKEWDRYGLSHNRVLETVCDELANAIDSTKAIQKSQKGFAIDNQGQFYPPAEKAADICRGLRQTIQEQMKHYQLDIDDLAELCRMTYEKEETDASLAFFPDEEISSDMVMTVKLDDGSSGSDVQEFPFDRLHLREVRKFMAGATSEDSLIFTGSRDKRKSAYTCRGYASLKLINHKNDKGIVPPIYVKLQGRKGATFYADGVPWFQLCDEQILAPCTSHRIAQLEICNELNLPEAQYSGLFEALSRQCKGTSVVFVDLSCEIVSAWYRALAAYGRAWKLQGISIIDLTEEQQNRICSLSRIDGSLIVDIHSGTLVYVGAVLDALSITEGRRDRGARGNSILSHVANLVLLGGIKQSVAAAIYSEDGMVTSVLGSSYYKAHNAQLAKCVHPLIKSFVQS